MKKLGFHVCLVFLLFWPFYLAHAADFPAKVIHITDGDTITVLKF